MLITPNLISGEDWQQYVFQLLALRYGFDLVKVPDEHQGDFGIEAFSRDGCAYQCYAPQQHLRTAELYKEQRDKVTEDLKKFVDNRDDLVKVLGPTKIHNWILVVQEHRSAKLTQHCQEKARKIRELGLPYCMPHFDVSVVTEDYFPVEIHTLLAGAGIKVEVGDLPTRPASVDDWAEKNDVLVRKMDEKLEPLPTFSTQAERRETRDRLLEMYVEGENSLQELKRKYPMVYDQIEILKRSRTRTLEIDSTLQKLTIAGTRSQFAEELTRRVAALGPSTAETISYAAIAEWLMICPLRPKG
jgi:hypothetical protein